MHLGYKHTISERSLTWRSKGHRQLCSVARDILLRKIQSCQMAYGYQIQFNGTAKNTKQLTASKQTQTPTSTSKANGKKQARTFKHQRLPVKAKGSKRPQPKTNQRPKWLLARYALWPAGPPPPPNSHTPFTPHPNRHPPTSSSPTPTPPPLA